MKPRVLASAATQPRQSHFTPDFCQEPAGVDQLQGAAAISPGSLGSAEHERDLPVLCHPRLVQRQALYRGGWGSLAAAMDQRRAMPSMPMTSSGFAPANPKEAHEDTAQPDGIGTIHEVDAGNLAGNIGFQHHARVQGITLDQAAFAHVSSGFVSREGGQGVIMSRP